MRALLDGAKDAGRFVVRWTGFYMFVVYIFVVTINNFATKPPSPSGAAEAAYLALALSGLALWRVFR